MCFIAKSSTTRVKHIGLVLCVQNQGLFCSGGIHILPVDLWAVFRLWCPLEVSRTSFFIFQSRHIHLVSLALVIHIPLCFFQVSWLILASCTQISSWVCRGKSPWCLPISCSFHWDYAVYQDLEKGHVCCWYAYVAWVVYSVSTCGKSGVIFLFCFLISSHN